MIEVEKYHSFIFDFDGVILDSNNIKKIAISKSVVDVLSVTQAKEFVKYFVNFNGIPREVKIRKYIPKDQYKKVLNRYENIIGKELKSAELVPGVFNFIQRLSDLNKKMFVLSGGTQSEVYSLLKDKRLSGKFDMICGGPNNKEENMQSLSLEHPVLYFGDSEVDYLIAKKYGFDFIFVYSVTSIPNWSDKIKDWKILTAISDFNNQIYI
jgi:phosphoglycolate phosphatase-like HAD superfamily hydrolase